MQLKTLGTEHVSLNEFSDWLHKPDTSKSLVYAQGELARDKELSKKAGRELQMVAEAALYAAGFRKNGEPYHPNKMICLTQRRVGPNCFDYIATKITPAKTAQ